MFHMKQIRSVLASIAIILAVGACAIQQPLTPRQELAIVETAFTSAVTELTLKCDDGVISLAKCSDAAPVISMMSATLDLAHSKLDGGQSIASDISAFRRQIRTLKSWGDN